MSKKDTRKNISNQKVREESKAKRRKRKTIRQPQFLTSSSKKSIQTKLDPRLGSKKPISLTATKKIRPITKKRYSTPQAELMAIENDKKLQELMDKLDNNIALSDEDQRFFDKKMARHLVFV